MLICAPPETVFRFFTDSNRFASWWGRDSEIESRPGGAVRIQYPDGTVASGEVLEIQPVQRIVFTYGYEAAGNPIPPGGSRVTIVLEDKPEGTLVRPRHDIAERVDTLFRAWRETDGEARRQLLESSTVAGVTFRDANSATDGFDDLDAHIAGAQRFMPGVALAREGEVRHCQGTAIDG